MGYFSPSELRSQGLVNFGENVYVSNKASIYGPENIFLGSNVRIDDFCVLSAGFGGIFIGSYVHVAVFSLLIGREKITLDNFCNISSRVSIYSSSDDYSGEWMTNPMVPVEYTGVHNAPVSIGRHVIIGSGSVILPGSTLDVGVSIGALSLVKDQCDSFGIYSGIPARKRGERKKNILNLEEKVIRDAYNHLA